jgi:hypothetical protein
MNQKPWMITPTFDAGNDSGQIEHQCFYRVHVLKFPCATFLESYLMKERPTIRIIVHHSRVSPP